MPESEQLYARLRQLAAEDPRQARLVFLEQFEANTPEGSLFLEQITKPGEGRLRQLVANSVRNHDQKHRILAVLLRWREAETDEFARRAIEGALDGVDFRQLSVNQEGDSAQSQIGEMYRYVAERLRHRLRNSMLAAQGYANRLRNFIPPNSASDAQELVAKLNDSMISLGRELQATDVDPEYFKRRSVALFDWITQMNERYASKYRSVRIVTNGNSSFRVTASDYLLETIFWNIWLNAQQAVGSDCQITIQVIHNGQHIHLLISDNGAGFPGRLADVAFQERYSSKHPSRGRGLLEIQDAVERLGGKVQLTEMYSKEYRLRLLLPLEH
jgi:signal transduction histidine kinase